MPLQTGVVGLGTVARNHHLSAVARNPRTRLAAVCDADGSRARAVGDEYGSRAYTDAREMLEDEALDWVHVATPVGTHREIAGMAVEAGVPTTLQKPATVTVVELDELLALSDRHSVPVSVVHNWLYYPVMREARRRVRRGDVGRIRAVETTFAGEGAPDETDRGSWVFDLPGGEFEEGMPHPLYLTVAVGGEPRSADAVDVRTRRADAYDADVAYDGVGIQYESDDGALCAVTFLSASSRCHEVRIHGADGALVVDVDAQTVRYHDPTAGPYHVLRERLERNADAVRVGLSGLLTNLSTEARSLVEDRLEWHLDDSASGHYYLLDRTARALEAGRQPPVPLERSRWPIELMERVRRTTPVQRAT